MSELTTEHFDETMRSLAKTLDEHTERFNKLDDSIERIEHHLWNEQRLAEHERRIIRIAETVGRPDLAVPFDRPIGS